MCDLAQMPIARLLTAGAIGTRTPRTPTIVKRSINAADAPQYEKSFLAHMKYFSSPPTTLFLFAVQPEIRSPELQSTNLEELYSL